MLWEFATPRNQPGKHIFGSIVADFEARHRGCLCKRLAEPSQFWQLWLAVGQSPQGPPCLSNGQTPNLQPGCALFCSFSECSVDAVAVAAAAVVVAAFGS